MPWHSALCSSLSAKNVYSNNFVNILFSFKEKYSTHICMVWLNWLICENKNQSYFDLCHSCTLKTMFSKWTQMTEMMFYALFESSFCSFFQNSFDKHYVACTQIEIVFNIFRSDDLSIHQTPFWVDSLRRQFVYSLLSEKELKITYWNRWMSRKWMNRLSVTICRSIFFHVSYRVKNRMSIDKFSTLLIMKNQKSWKRIHRQIE